MFKLMIYEVTEAEKPYFEDNKPDNFEVKMDSKKLDDKNINDAKGCDGVLVTGGCVIDKKVIDQFVEWGIKYVFTRSVGLNKFDVKYATEKGIVVANVPAYSPRAVAELAFTLGITLFRHVSEATYNTHIADFRVLSEYFSNEIHDATVGIIGAGTIGTAEAELYKAMGANVLAYQRHPDENNTVVNFVSLQELLKTCDIVSIHVPLVAGTRGMIGKEELAMMKDSAILINTARGGVVDNDAVADALESQSINGYGADVLLDEDHIMRRQFDSLDDLPDETDKKLMRNYPNVIITPHMGFFTKEAVKGMATMSYDNFESVIKTGKAVYPVN